MYRESLDLAWEVGRRWRIAYALFDVAAVSALDGSRALTATRAFAAADALRNAAGLSLSPAEQTRVDEGIALARTALDEASFAAAWEAGQRLPLHDAVAEALAPPTDGAGEA